MHDQTNKNAVLFMASNHIGNLEDTPKRTSEIVKNADLLIVEEDRKAKELLKHIQIHRNYLKFNEHHQEETLTEIKKAFKLKKTVCYISDQGAPTLCDPGFDVLKIAYEHNVSIKVIPGPSSLTAALSACPFDTSEFFFTGFLPRKPKEKEIKIKSLIRLNSVVILLETPYRRNQLLEFLSKHYGSNRKAFLALDISGSEEEYLYGSFKKLLEQVQNKKKLNFVLIINKAK